MRQKVGFIFLHTLLMCTLYSCKSDNTANTAFDDKIILIENNPQQYLARIDTIRPNSVNDEKEATDFLLYSLAHNYINRNTTVQRNYPIGSVDLNRNHSSDVLV